MAADLDYGSNTYDLEDEAGLLSMDPAQLGDRYAFMQEFPTADVMAKQNEQQKDISKGKLEHVPPDVQKDAAEKKAKDQEGEKKKEGAEAAPPEKKPEEDAQAGKESKEEIALREELAKLGEELDLIVADNMYADLMEDYIYKIRDFKTKAEGAKAPQIMEATIALLNKVARVLYMSPSCEGWDVELKLYLIQDVMLPIMPVMTLQFERIWLNLQKDKAALNEKGAQEEEEEEEEDEE